MNTKRSYLDTLNAGRQRRSGGALEEINRTLDSLADRLENALESREQAGHGGRTVTTRPRVETEAARRAEAAGGDDMSRATLERIAGEIEALRQREGKTVSADNLSSELNALREDMRTMVNTGIRQELGGLREELAHVLADFHRAPPANAELSAEFERLSDAITRLSQRSDDDNSKKLRLELEQVKTALSDLVRENTAEPQDGSAEASEARHVQSQQSDDDLSDRLHARLEEISAAIGKLPDSQSLQNLDERVHKLAASLDQLAETHAPNQSDLHGMIEERLDEISRAITASTAVAHSQAFDPAPLERVEARVSSLASQIDELVQDQSGSVIIERLNALSDRFDEVAQRMGVPEQIFEQLTGHIAELSKKLDSAPQEREAQLLSALESRFLELFEHLEKRQDDSFHQEQSQFQDLRLRLGEVAERLDRSGEDAAGTGVMAALDKRFSELSERIESMRQGAQDSPDLQALQARLDEISDRLQEHSGPITGIDPAMIQSLETQVANLAAQTAHTNRETPKGEEITPRLDNIERSIGTYHAEMMDAAQQAAEQAVQKLSTARHDEQLKQELQTLEALTRKSDERNSRTFEAVHDTLLKIVARLGELEGGNGGQDEALSQKIAVENTPSIDPADGFHEDEESGSPDEGASAHRTPAEAAIAAAEAALQEEDKESSSAPDEKKKSMLGGLSRALTGRRGRAPAAETREDPKLTEDTDGEETSEAGIDPKAVNEPLEPGSGAPDLNTILRRVRDEGGITEEKPSADTAKSDFIAAARRAAKAAAAEAEMLKHDRSSSAERGKKSGLGGIIRRHKKSLLVLAGTAIIIAGGAHLANSMLSGSDRPMARTGAPASVEEAQATAQGDAEQAQAEPSQAENDETVTGAVPEQTPAVPQDSPMPSGTESISTEASGTPEELATSAEAQAEASSPDPLPKISALREGAVDESVTTVRTALPDIPKEAGPEALRQAAAEGQPEALFEIGNRYADRHGVEADLPKAAEWYRLAAERGLAPAQYRLGSLYEKGLGVERDADKAKEWYLKAARQGNASAMHNLGVLFAVGVDGTSDNASAAEWFMKAAELGVPDSQVNLGILAAKGAGLPRDLTEAYKWFAIAAESGDTDAAAKRDEVAKVLSEADLDRAKAKTELWEPREANTQANIINIPDAWTVDQESTASVDMKQAITNVQLILNKNGFDAGPADGIMGERTRAAIRMFQEQNGLPATGEIDEPLIRALLEKNKAAG